MLIQFHLTQLFTAMPYIQLIESGICEYNLL
jgi:hypothetical protein